jgi:hypothetical protein
MAILAEKDEAVAKELTNLITSETALKESNEILNKTIID